MQYFLRIVRANSYACVSEWLIRFRSRALTVNYWVILTVHVPPRFTTGSLGVRTRRRRKKLLTASCSLLPLWDWKVSSRTSSRSSPTLGLGMGREVQRSEQELYSLVSTTKTENVVTRGDWLVPSFSSPLP